MSLAGPLSTVDPAKPTQEHDKINEKSSSEVERGDTLEDIDPENEVQGIKLLLIHIAVCLCTFLVGLVSITFLYISQENFIDMPCAGLQSHCHCSSQHHERVWLPSRCRLVRGQFHGRHVS